MESLTPPLFMSMTNGIHRLEQQEQQELKDATAAREASQGVCDDVQSVPTRRRCEEGLARCARRVTIRLACMANRCFWLSVAEVVVRILTDGDC